MSAQRSPHTTVERPPVERVLPAPRGSDAAARASRRLMITVQHKMRALSVQEGGRLLQRGATAKTAGSTLGALGAGESVVVQSMAGHAKWDGGRLGGGEALAGLVGLGSVHGVGAAAAAAHAAGPWAAPHTWAAHPPLACPPAYGLT